MSLMTAKEIMEIIPHRQPFMLIDTIEELEEGKKGIFLLGGKVSDLHKFQLPDSDLQRSFVVIDKVKKTPKAYPRKAGTPSKDPLH